MGTFKNEDLPKIIKEVTASQSENFEKFYDLFLGKLFSIEDFDKTTFTGHEQLLLEDAIKDLIEFSTLHSTLTVMRVLEETGVVESEKY